MKIRFNKNHIDFVEGKEYDVNDGTATYLVRLGVAKEVVTKAKEPVKPKQPKAKKLAKEVVTKELKTDIENK